MKFSDHDREILRRLAGEVAEFSFSEDNDIKREMWRKHNALQQERPLVMMYTEEGMWNEVFAPDKYEAESDLARKHERELRELIHWHTTGDDRPFEPVYFLGLVTHNSGWGVSRHTIGSGMDTGSLHFDPVIVEGSDIDKIEMPQIKVDREATADEREALEDAFGDLLPIEERGYFVPWFAPIDMFIEWRGIENLFMDMMMQPDWVHAVLEKLTRGYLGMLDQYEAQDALWCSNRSHFVGSGGCGYTDELPQPDFDGHVRPMDMWGQATAQIFSEVSAEMHEEFSLKYDIQWQSRFGLNCYGCCEPLHFKMDILRQIPRLRRISMSPKADWAAGAEKMGRDFIFSAKPNPAVFAVDKWDTDKVRADLRRMLERTKGCNVELVMKDTQTCRNEPHRIMDWTRIAVEECKRAAE
ncbi:MAG: hypothetical protein ACLFUS_12345 [Candidatus Sumerlaeia bacterium]